MASFVKILFYQGTPAPLRRRYPVGSPPGRSMCIQDEVSTRINGSALPARGLKLLRCDQIRTGAGVLDEFRHAHTAVEVRDSSDDGFAFGLRFCEPDGILKLIFGNINSSFHASKIAVYRSSIKHNYILSGLSDRS